MIYLDYAANTPVNPKVLKVFNDATLTYFGNPNSLHKNGNEAKRKIDESSQIIADYFHTKKENIIYTSGSSESNNLIIKGITDRYKNKGKHIIISAIEHSSIIAPCNYLASNGYEITVIPLLSNGEIDIDSLKKALRKDTILVSVSTVDPELGTIEPIQEIAKILKDYPNAYFHTDATGAIGKIDISYDGVDFLTFAPHKFYGLNGIGVLINFNDIKITPLIHGGKSTTIYRGGTPVTASIIATSTALQEATKKLDDNIKYISNLKNELINKLKEIKKIHINTPTNSIPNIVNFSLNNADEIVKKLSDKKIYVSTKTACSSKNAPSKSVLAVTKDLNLAKNSIRVSLSHLTTKEEIDIFLKELTEVINENN